MENLLTIMRRLRGPQGCPWDQKQTHETLRQYMLEEAYEAVDALSENDTLHIVEELGDVLLQIAFHTVIAEETARFSYPNIEKTIVDKLIRRHPHIFGDVNVADADEVVKNWQAIKAQEKAVREKAAGEQGGKPVLSASNGGAGEKFPRHLPALMLAAEVSKKQKWLPESSSQIDSSESLGDALLALVNKARELGLNPEIALRDAVDRRLNHEST
jgi:MazG family protein